MFNSDMAKSIINSRLRRGLNVDHVTMYEQGRSFFFHIFFNLKNENKFSIIKYYSSRKRENGGQGWIKSLFFNLFAFVSFSFFKFYNISTLTRWLITGLMLHHTRMRKKIKYTQARALVMELEII